MNPLDNMGNQLNKGDLVAVHIGDRTLTGVIANIKEASILMGKDQPMPGLMTIQLPVNFMFHSQAPKIMEVFKMQKPPGFEKQVS